MRKRTIALLLVLAALAGVAVSRAYLFAAGRVATENIITYGTLTMKLHETDGNGDPVSMNGSPILRLTGAPRETVRRKITVENTCDEEMYLRMRLSIGGTSDDGKTFMLSEQEVECAANAAGGWQTGGDGWYYYTAVLMRRSITEPLLKDNQLLFYTDEIAKTHPNRELTLSVEVQAVQSKNNGADALHAQGWPEEASKP